MAFTPCRCPKKLLWLGPRMRECDNVDSLAIYRENAKSQLTKIFSEDEQTAPSVGTNNICTLHIL
jgi:hypothetical protein